MMFLFFFKQKTAYEMRISDWSSDVCSSDLIGEDGKAKYYGLQAGEKTYADYVLEVTNPGGHSSRPTGTNAIVQLSNALAKVGAYRFAPQQNELTTDRKSVV